MDDSCSCTFSQLMVADTLLNSHRNQEYLETAGYCILLLDPAAKVFAMTPEERRNCFPGTISHSPCYVLLFTQGCTTLQHKETTPARGKNGFSILSIVKDVASSLSWQDLIAYFPGRRFFYSISSSSTQVLCFLWLY